MKKMICFLMGMILFIIPLTAAENINFSYANSVELNRGDSCGDNYGIDFNVSFAAINSSIMKTEKGDFIDLSIDGYTFTKELGTPRLPMLRKIISVPLAADVQAYATSYDLTDLQLSDYDISRIYPAQPSVEKCLDRAEVKFAYNEVAYKMNNFSSNPIVSVDEIGIMRGERLFAVNFYPVQYNAVTNVLRVYNDVNIKVEFRGADLLSTEELKAKTYSPVFESVLASNVFNYTTLNNRDELTRYPMKYLIISDPMFEAQLEPFITWKTEEGFEVIAAYTDDIGTTTTAIKNYIQGIWDDSTTEDPAPSYLLICGDVGQVPAFSGGTGGHITDLNYVRLEGNDFIPEMYYGRFSARNTDEFQPQIDKTLEYEKYEMPDPSYLGEVVMIAGMDSGHGPTHGNGQINYGVDYYFNEAHGIESHTYLYPESGSNAANIIQNIIDGVGYVNYTAHGYYEEWSNPHIDNNDLAGLDNEHKYPVVVGNCCLTNHFNTPNCFGEQWLRLEGKGAVGYIGGTNSTYWDEDYWWGVGSGAINANPSYETHGRGVYDGLFHDQANEVDFSTWYTTTGQIIFNGNLAVTEGGSTSYDYYWEIYSLMGDPSLNVYLGVPQENNATIPSTIFLGINEVQISADPNSYVAISMEGVLYGTALIDETGSVNVTIDPFATPGTARIVITSPNKVPIIAGIDVIPNDGPFVVLDTFELIDGNDNLPAYTETISMNVTLENVGSDPATAVTAVLASNDPYITITSAEATFGDIAAETSVTVNSAFAFEIANNVPDQHIAPLSVTASAEATWISNFNIIINAPSFEIGNMIIDDSAGNNNGMLDAGEVATISIPVSNIGHAVSQEISAILTSANPEILVVNTASVSMNELTIGETAMAAFDVTVADDAPVGITTTLGFSLTSGAYTATASFIPSIGLVYEDFETGDFTKFEWNNGIPGWEINTDAQEGTYSAQSADINDDQIATLSITMDISADGEISFWKKVSSENNYDFLKFFINGYEVASWSGNVDWSEETFDVSAGETIFEWKYDKDGSVSDDADCAWIDYIVFPGGGGAAGNPIASVSTDEINFDDVTIDYIATEQFTISNIGAASLEGTITAPTGFTVSEESYTVVAGANVTIDVIFAPTEATEYTGNIVITTNDPNNAEINIAVTGTGIVGPSVDNPEIPAVTSLQGNYPNPFNPTTTIKFGLKEESNVKLEIYNIRGQKVRTLVNERQSAGYHTVSWEGTDDNSNKIASGIYFYRLTTDRYTSTKKMILMK